MTNGRNAWDEIEGVHRILKPSLQIVKRMLLLFKPFGKKVSVIMGCMLISSIITLMLPLISKRIVDQGLLTGNYNVVVRFSIICFLLLMIEQGLGIWETRNRSYINAMMQFTLAKKAFRHLLKLKLSYFHHKNFAEIINNLSMDIMNVSRISDRNSFFVVMNLLKMLGGLGGLLLINWKLAVLVVLMVPFRFIMIRYLARKRKQAFEKYMGCLDQYYSWYGDTITGIKEIKLMGLERRKTSQFIKAQREITQVNIRLELLDQLNEFSEMAVFHLITNTLYILSAYLIIFHHSLTIGGLFAFITFSGYVTGPISAIMNIGYQFTMIIPSANRLFGFLELEMEPHPAGPNKMRIQPDLGPGAITFENVSFSFDQGAPALKNISFTIEPGEKVAIIGKNGSGKTTLINLLLRFHTPDCGRILLDGNDISSYSLKDYRGLISVVSQDLYLFHETLKDNIAPHHKAPDAVLDKIMQAGGADQLLRKLPHKYQTMVENNGANFSGGERQKIAVARALVKDFSILILDEATSNYDTESEQRLLESLQENVIGKTIIMITHNPRLLKMVDRVVVLQQGAIVALGKHEELYMRNQTYQEILADNEKTHLVRRRENAYVG